MTAGPGLAVRVLGDVTEGDALDVLRQVDEIYINTIRDFGLYDNIWQAFAVFLPVRCALPLPMRCTHLSSRMRSFSTHLFCLCLYMLKFCHSIEIVPVHQSSMDNLLARPPMGDEAREVLNMSDASKIVQARRNAQVLQW